MSEQGGGEIADAARGWVIRVRDAAFADWDGLTDWLEGAPEHARAYDRAADIDDAIGALFETSRPLVIPPSIDRDRFGGAPSRRGAMRWLVGGGAIAATVALAVGWSAMTPATNYRTIATAPGQRQSVQLADGSAVHLNGGTTVRLDAARPRWAALDDGEAVFAVRHDARDPFVVDAGDTRLVDAGTVFNVARDRAAIEVGVSEGAVIYQPGSRQIRLDPGDRLTARTGQPARVERVAIDAVGSWREGRLVYAGAGIDRIAADLARAIGAPVRAGPGTADIRFTGIFTTSRDATATMATVAPLIGVRARRAGDGWVLEGAGADS